MTRFPHPLQIQTIFDFGRIQQQTQKLLEQEGSLLVIGHDFNDGLINGIERSRGKILSMFSTVRTGHILICWRMNLFRGKLLC